MTPPAAQHHVRGWCQAWVGLLRRRGRDSEAAARGASSQDERRGKKPQLQRRRADRSQRSGINASKLDKRQGECEGGDATGNDQPAWRDSGPRSQDHGATQPTDCEQRHPKQLTDAAAVAVQRLIQKRDLVGRTGVRRASSGMTVSQRRIPIVRARVDAMAKPIAVVASGERAPFVRARVVQTATGRKRTE